MWRWKSEFGPTGANPRGHFTGVLLGEQAVSKAAAQGSTPCIGAFLNLFEIADVARLRKAPVL